MTDTIDVNAAARRLYEMNGFALYGRSLGDWEDGDSEIGRSHYERLRWVTQVRHLAEAVGMSLRFDNCCGPGEGCAADNCSGVPQTDDGDGEVLTTDPDHVFLSVAGHPDDDECCTGSPSTAEGGDRS